MPDRAAILLSVHPKWARKILPLAPGTEPVGDEATKTVELRRRRTRRNPQRGGRPRPLTP